MGRLLALLTLFLATPAFAQMDFAKMQLAGGLSETIKNSKHCNYKIDQDKLEKFYSTSGLDEPEVLAWISADISLAEYGDKPDASACTISKVTARSIGILME